MMNITVEKMGENHVEKLALIEKECFSTPWSENALREELENSHARFLVAVCDGEVSGYIGAHNILGEVYITNVAVSEKHRRKGMGEKLITSLISLCVSENAEFITLEVRESNKPAINLYKKMNFKDVGKRKNFYENPREDAILMTYKPDGEI